MLTIFCCNPEQSLHEQMVAECERECREHERELDLQREAELNPPTEVQWPEAFCAAVMHDWDAYRRHSGEAAGG